MPDLLDRVAATGLLRAGSPVLVLLSGGRDSVCLLDVAVRIAGAPHVAALHCNYGLRAASDADEAHCATLCERLGVELHVRRPRRRETAGNLQAWAHERRYAEAATLAHDRGGDVAAGHTASDQVEIVLYRLAASPGRRALLGMAPREGDLVRPLLGVSREQTAAHCAARGLVWREDESNESPAYARNRVRHELLPALTDAMPGLAEALLATARGAASWRETLDAHAASISRVADDGGAVAVDVATLAAYGRAELAILWPAIAARIGLAMDWRGTERAAAFTNGSRTGSRIQLSGGWEIVRTREEFSLRRWRDRRREPAHRPFR
jgi:tRNA(Ile)-lysidine synthase